MLSHLFGVGGWAPQHLGEKYDFMKNLAFFMHACCSMHTLKLNNRFVLNSVYEFV